jgi:hypothetical protein
MLAVRWGVLFMQSAIVVIAFEEERTVRCPAVFRDGITEPGGQVAGELGARGQPFAWFGPSRRRTFRAIAEVNSGAQERYDTASEEGVNYIGPVVLHLGCKDIILVFYFRKQPPKEKAKSFIG